MPGAGGGPKNPPKRSVQEHFTPVLTMLGSTRASKLLQLLSEEELEDDAKEDIVENIGSVTARMSAVSYKV